MLKLAFEAGLSIAISLKYALLCDHTFVFVFKDLFA